MRIAIVTPRYWPQSGDVETFATRLCDELLAAGAVPRVLTAKWSPDWPASIFVRETHVARTAHAPRGGLHTIRYMIESSRWLRRQQTELDIIYVLNLRHEAYATIGALRDSCIPVVLHCHESGPAGDCHWQQVAQFGERIRQRCQQADAIVAASQTAVEELVANGYTRGRVHLDPGGVPPLPVRSADRRYRARAALAETLNDLAVAEYAPVVISIGRLDDHVVYLPLLRAWRDVAARWPSARLWLIGEGSAREALYEQIAAWDLRYQVFMPGSFEDFAELWLAADLYVALQPERGPQLVLEAMAAGLPILAPDSPWTRPLIDHGRCGLLVPPTSHNAWRDALCHFCEHPTAAAAMGTQAHQTAERQYSSHRCVQRHLELFEQLLRRKDRKC